MADTAASRMVCSRMFMVFLDRMAPAHNCRPATAAAAGNSSRIGQPRKHKVAPNHRQACKAKECSIAANILRLQAGVKGTPAAVASAQLRNFNSISSADHMRLMSSSQARSNSSPGQLLQARSQQTVNWVGAHCCCHKRTRHKHLQGLLCS